MRSKAIVYSSYPLSQKEIDGLVKIFTFLKDLDIKNIVDKSLFAGVKIITEDKVIDLTLKEMLNSLKSKLYDID